MDNVFGLLLLVTIGALISGVIRPSLFSKQLKQHANRKQLSLGFGGLALLFFVLVGITAPQPIQVSNTSASKPVPSVSEPKVQSDNVTKKTETTTQPIPFTTTTEQNASLAKGTTQIKTQGVNGVQTQTYNVTYTNGVESDRQLVSTVVTTPPVTQVVENGTYVAPPAPAYVAPTPAPVATPTPAPSRGCYPLTNGGNCYEPGEYCRNSDHGATGLAGDGESITCAYNNGWRWEPN